MASLPTFVIIGAQKSASSFILHCLSDHPEIHAPKGEIAFFESPDYENGHISDLERLFEGRSEPQRGIKRPQYICEPAVPARLAKDLPDAKLIAVLRNPVDRLVSAYFHNIRDGFIPALEVEKGLQRLLDDPAYRDQYKRSKQIIDYGYYHEGLKRYDYFRKKGQLQIFLHEDIIKEPLKIVQQCYDYLGVDPDFVPPSLNSRPQKVMYNTTRLKWVTLRNRFGTIYYEDRTRLYRKEERTRFEKAAIRFINIVDNRILSLFFKSEKPTLDPTTRKRLYELYADDIDKLEDYLDRDLSAWRVD